jgi:tetratricopeptide (TPR) repeat protein
VRQDKRSSRQAFPKFIIYHSSFQKFIIHHSKNSSFPLVSNTLLASVIALVLALFACKNDPKPTPEALRAVQQDPELAALSAAVEKSPEDDSLRYLRAAAYYRLDAYDEALRDLELAIGIDSMQPQYYHLAADIFLDYARPNDSKRAITVLKDAARKFPGRTSTLLKLSEFQLIVRQHGEALATLDRIFQQDPSNPEAAYMAGRVALDKGDTTNAVKMFQKSVATDAENTDAWMFLGRIYSLRNNPLAIQFFNNVIRLDSLNLDARQFQGEFYKRRGDNEKALAIYRDIIRRNPDYSNAYFDVGIIYLDQDSLSKAYDNFDIAIKTEPLFINAFYYRGLCSEKRGDAAAALADYRRAAGMAPDFAEARDAKARLEKAGVQ